MINSLFLLASYLVGAIPFGLLISKAVGVDVRWQGSRNIGATNVGRVLGKKLGFLTLVCDVTKGYLPMRLAYLYLPEGEVRQQIISLCGVMAVVGHMFPVYLKFKGGKGVATGLGVFLFFSPATIAISLVIFIAAVTSTGFVSVGSLLASALVPLWIWLFGGNGTTILAAATIAFLIWIKHWENIARLLKGEEKTWKKQK
jgi:acyl phosphate:glycerol-3-phosphate acyltransferase